MKKYIVNFNGYITWQTEIEANNEEEAQQIAEWADPGDFIEDKFVSINDMEIEVGDIYEE